MAGGVLGVHGIQEMPPLWRARRACHCERAMVYLPFLLVGNLLKGGTFCSLARGCMYVVGVESWWTLRGASLKVQPCFKVQVG